MISAGPDFLARMVEASRARAASEAEATDPPALTGPRGRLRAALRRPAAGGLGIIAEVKRSSPSRGALAAGLDAAARALAYERAGADAVSVLTEPTAFNGSLDDLRAVAAAVGVPVLRKDFIVDQRQVRAAADCGAAAVLLIVAALDDVQLRGLLAACAADGLDALVEVHTEHELRRALAAGADLVGINNRDLTSLAVDTATSERLAPLVPTEVTLVAASGIAGAADAAHMAAAGADALLVGEALVRLPEDELPAAVADLRAAAALIQRRARGRAPLNPVVGGDRP